MILPFNIYFKRPGRGFQLQRKQNADIKIWLVLDPYYNEFRVRNCLFYYRAFPLDDLIVGVPRFLRFDLVKFS